MLVDLDQFEMLYLLEGVSIGSHLRQHIWTRAVDNWYNEMEPSYAETVFTYSRRDISPKYEPRTIGDTLHTPFGAEEFNKFLACFNPANRYLVSAKCGKHKEKDVPCFLYNGTYHTKMNTWMAREYITDIKHVPFEKCCNTLCGMKDKCARFTEDSDEVEKEGRFDGVYHQKYGCDFILDTDVLESYRHPVKEKEPQPSQPESQD